MAVVVCQVTLIHCRTPSPTTGGGPAAQVAAQAARDNAAKVVAGLQAEVGGLKGIVWQLEAEAAAASQEVHVMRQAAEHR
jgi:hypothetical protein